MKKYNHHPFVGVIEQTVNSSDFTEETRQKFYNELMLKYVAFQKEVENDGWEFFQEESSFHWVELERKITDLSPKKTKCWIRYRIFAKREQQSNSVLEPIVAPTETKFITPA